jgi:hypothetical protein
MSKRKPRNLPAPFSRTHRKLAHWRKLGRPGARIPETLWAEAVQLARVHGINPTARALGLDYYSLKKRVFSPSDHEVEPHGAAQDFVEILPAGVSGPRSACTIELEDKSGGKMRIQLESDRIPDLTGLALLLRRNEA